MALPIWIMPPVAKVVQEYQYSLCIFSSALVMLMVSAILWSWTRRVSAAFSVTLLSMGSLYLIYVTSSVALRRFDVPRSKLVTGRFDGANQGYSSNREQSLDGFGELRCLMGIKGQSDEKARTNADQRDDVTVVYALLSDRILHLLRHSANTVARAWRHQYSLRVPSNASQNKKLHPGITQPSQNEIDEQQPSFDYLSRRCSHVTLPSSCVHGYGKMGIMAAVHPKAKINVSSLPQARGLIGISEEEYCENEMFRAVSCGTLTQPSSTLNTQ